MRAQRLAMFGGPPSVGARLRRDPWPLITVDDRRAVDRVLREGPLVCSSPRQSEVDLLESDWAQFLGVRHCVATSNGTTALSLALAACDIGPGDEVLVPALSFVGSPLSVIHMGATPVFVDIDPRTFSMDVAAARRAVTTRTRAVMPVHLHGLPADMAELDELARARDLLVIEDAAQAHGATYRGNPCGSLGKAAAFSLNVTKNLPTCGEGGLLTTNDERIAERARAMRQFGERLRGPVRRYRSQMLGWNFKLSAVQAAFTRSQLSRFEGYARAREPNIAKFLARVSELPGVTSPPILGDRTTSWHIIRLRIDPAAAGFPDVPARSFRRTIERALMAEGASATPYQEMPLPEQPVFSDTASGPFRAWLDPVRERLDREGYPVTRAVIDDSITLQRWHLAPRNGPLLDAFADAFLKVWENLDAIATMASAMKAQQRVTVGGHR